MSSNGSISFANDASLPSWKDNPTSHQISSQTTTPETLMEKQSSSFPWILHHILEKESSNELPLRIMFTFNAGQQLPTLKQAHEWWQYEPKGKLIIQFLASLPPSEQTNEPVVKELKEIKRKLERISEVTEVGELSQHFEHHEKCEFDPFIDPTHQHLVDIDLADDASSTFGRRTSGFPTHFIRNVCLNKVFLEDYATADFTQALTCLDYLRDLECTRRTALREAALRLGISKNNWKAILLEEPDAYRWVSAVQKQELTIESLFAACFVDLRIWTMAHELQSTPFYKPNVLAMLNTLFPPAMKEMPNDKIDIKALHKYRATFYQHVLAVEAKGTGIVKEFIEKLLEPKAKHSWSETRRHLEEYISLADTMINEAKAVEGIEFFHDATSSRHSRTISAARSSFSERPQTASSANTSVDGTFPPPKSPGIALDNVAKKAGPVFVFGKDTFAPPPPTTSTSPEPTKNFSSLSFRERAANSGGVKATTSSLSASRKGILTKRTTPLSITIPPPKAHAPSNASPDMHMHRNCSAVGSTDSPTTSITKFDSNKGSRTLREETTSSKKNFPSQFDFLTRPFHSPSSASAPVEGVGVGVKRKRSISSFLLRRKTSVGSGHTSSTRARSSSDGEQGSTVDKGSEISSMDSLDKGRAPSTPGGGISGEKGEKVVVKKSHMGLNGRMARPGDDLPPLPPLPGNVPMRGLGMGLGVGVGVGAGVGVGVQAKSPRKTIDRIDDSADVSTKLDALGFALIDLSFRDESPLSPRTRGGFGGAMSGGAVPGSPVATSFTGTEDFVGDGGGARGSANESGYGRPLNGTTTGRLTGRRISAAPAPLNVRKASDAREEVEKEVMEEMERQEVEVERKEVERERQEMERERQEEREREWVEFDRPRVAPKPPEGGRKTVILDVGRFGGRF